MRLPLLLIFVVSVASACQGSSTPETRDDSHIAGGITDFHRQAHTRSCGGDAGVVTITNARPRLGHPYSHRRDMLWSES